MPIADGHGYQTVQNIRTFTRGTKEMPASKFLFIRVNPWLMISLTLPCELQDAPWNGLFDHHKNKASNARTMTTANPTKMET